MFVGGHFILVAGPVWVGHSLPARYIMTVIPLVAVPLLSAIAVSAPARWIFVPLLGLSLVITAVGVLNHTLLYPDGSGAAALPVANRLQEVWPDFAADARRPATVRPEFTVQPPTAQRQTGRLIEDTAASVTYAAPGTDATGMLAYGPYRSVKEGSYLARFHLAAKGSDPIQQVAVLDVQTDLPSLFTALARRELRLGDLPTGGGYATIELAFTVSQPSRIETRVQYLGETELWLGSVDVIRTVQPASLEQQFPSWPRTVLWVVGTALIGGLLGTAARQSANGHVSMGTYRTRRSHARRLRRTQSSEPPLVSAHEGWRS